MLCKWLVVPKAFLQVGDERSFFFSHNWFHNWMEKCRKSQSNKYLLLSFLQWQSRGRSMHVERLLMAGWAWVCPAGPFQSPARSLHLATMLWRRSPCILGDAMPWLWPWTGRSFLGEREMMANLDTSAECMQISDRKHLFVHLTPTIPHNSPKSYCIYHLYDEL